MLFQSFVVFGVACGVFMLFVASVWDGEYSRVYRVPHVESDRVDPEDDRDECWSVMLSNGLVGAPG